MHKNKKFNSTSKFTFVKPLSQSDLADGWKLIVPSVKFNTTDENNNKKFNNIYRSKINLAQLPYHLWSKNNNNKVVEKSHIYYIQPTEVDTEIKELAYIIMNSQLYSKDYVINLLKKLKDADIYGWLIIKAMKLYSLNMNDIL